MSCQFIERVQCFFNLHSQDVLTALEIEYWLRNRTSNTLIEINKLRQLKKKYRDCIRSEIGPDPATAQHRLRHLNHSCTLPTRTAGTRFTVAWKKKVFIIVYLFVQHFTNSSREIGRRHTGFTLRPSPEQHQSAVAVCVLSQCLPIVMQWRLFIIKFDGRIGKTLPAPLPWRRRRRRFPLV